jgi:hypothetical protein
MKVRLLFLCAAGLGLAGLAWQMSRSKPVTSTPVPLRAPANAPAPVSSAKDSQPSDSPAPSALPPLARGEAALEAIQTAAASYDAKAVPELARYLESNSPEIRAAALQGLIQLGERDAIPYLKAAAQNTTIREESVELLKAADFLALPTWQESRQAIKASLQSSPH